MGDKYPDIPVHGDTFPPSALRMRMAQFLGAAKLLVIAMILGGIDPFPSLGMPTPSVYQWMTTNKMYACLLVFFISNTLEGQLVSTGAFEISFNDVPVWSKLETGRLPSPAELFQIVDNQVMLRESGGSLTRS